MKGRKILLLLVVLLLPTFIFLFLHQFAENKFDVAIQHLQGLQLEGCNNNSSPFTVPPIDSLGIHNINNGLTLIYIEDAVLDKEKLNKLRRVTQNHPEQKFLLLHHSDVVQSLQEYKQDNWLIYKLKKANLVELNRCAFGNIVGQPLVLMDEQRHIRGYYAMDNKELDRLEGEIQILNE